MRTIVLVFSILFTSVTVKAQRNDTILYQNWANGSWVDNHAVVQTYDTNGVQVGQKSDLWDNEIGVFYEADKMVFHNNEQGKVILREHSIFEKHSKAVKAFGKNQYYYTGTGKVESLVASHLTDGIFVNNFKNTWKYDENDSIIEAMSFDWNIDSSKWINRSKTKWNYNGGGKVERYSNWNWDKDSGTWKESSQVHYEYDSFSGNTKTRTSYNVHEGVLWYTSKIEFYYDADNRVKSEERFLRDRVNNAWRNDLQINYVRNADGSLHYEISQRWDSEKFIWNNNSKTIYTTGILTNVEEATSSSIKVYPNPATNYINFSSLATSIFLTNSVGKTHEYKSGYELYVGDLSRGLYLLSYTDEKGIYHQQKLVLK